MKLGVMNPVLSQFGFEDALKYLNSLDVHEMEIGAGGYPGNCHLKPEELLGDPAKIAEYKALMAKYDVSISAISCHGNPLHPQKAIAEKFDSEFRNAILVAEALGVKTVIGFAGCPGDCENSLYPNWVVCPWPDDNLKIVKWQWEEKVIPYWKKTAAFAQEHGIKKIAFEMHPGFCVYNPETMMKIRNAVGPILGANLDPSHLFWQGIDPVYAIRYLGDAIYYFHAKDTKIDEINTKTHGVLDTKHYGDEIHRSWIFRSVGYGHDYQTWKDIMSNLRLVGYDGPISIEHEDSLMTPGEGLDKAIDLLKSVLMFQDRGGMYWA